MIYCKYHYNMLASVLESTLWLSGYGIGLVPVQPGFNSQPGMENFSAMLYTSHSLNVVRMLLL